MFLRLKCTLFWYITPCSLVEFTDIIADCLVYSSALNMEAVIFLDMLITFYNTTGCNAVSYLLDLLVDPENGGRLFIFSKYL
jgi:hypothetical protein